MINIDFAIYSTVFSSLLQIAFLNKTLKAISLKANSPQSVVSISKDINQLKKGMADTGQEITAVKDTVTQTHQTGSFTE